MTTRSGGKSTSFYDGAGNLTSSVAPRGNVSGASPASVKAPDGGSTVYDYEGVGNLTARTDPDGNTWAYAYDAANRLIGATDPLGKSSAYALRRERQPADLHRPRWCRHHHQLRPGQVRRWPSALLPWIDHVDSGFPEVFDVARGQRPPWGSGRWPRSVHRTPSIGRPMSSR